ncbi:short-chain dehydrogenase/reductase [Rhodococcus opacus]|uniref:short-chain dehydrogenase/reductase n=1 Tax=Rhodococcus opacus TaxID=37919 RepID=UPI0022369B5D|nr:short-chain dehydrogenase/reductase [Rhodococcus opacus]UZG60344.1 short-chain dehydrogenase/reductase [Rhodococcus opacus]
MTDKLTVAGKTVLITGAARGIGAAVARRLYAKGANLSLVGIEPDLLTALAAELGPRAAAFPADVTDQLSLDAAVAVTLDRFGNIDVVFANAGIAPPTTTIAAITPSDFEHTLDVNLYGVWRTVKATLPHVIDSGGHMLLIASIYAFLNGALNASYAVSKAGVEQLGRALRVELATTDATAGVAYCGFIDTQMVRTAFSQDSAATLRNALPSFITKPMELDTAGAKIVRGIERRSARVTMPWWVTSGLFARGALSLLDSRLAADTRVRAAINLAAAPGGHSRGQR